MMCTIKNRAVGLLMALFCTSFLWTQTPQPVPVTISERIENVDGTVYHLHTVLQGQTLYSISRAYQVTSGEIKRTSNKLEIQVHEILLIPVHAKRLKALKNNEIPKTTLAQIVTPSAPKTETPPSPPPAETTPTDTTTNSVPNHFAKEKKLILNVALMLPLYLNDVENIYISTKQKDSDKKPRPPKPFTFVTLYEGAALAAQTFSESEVKINLQVFDVTDDENTATSLINSGKLNDIDLIVGPVFLRSFKMMSDFAKQRNIFIINPLSEKDEILTDNPFVVRITPSMTNQLQGLLNYVAKQHAGQRVLVVANTRLEEEKTYFEQAQLYFQNSPNRFDSVVFIDISQHKFQYLNNSLSNKGNAILYLSENEPLVTEILTQISKREKSPDALYCLQKLNQLEFTETRYLNDLQAHYVSPFFVHYPDENENVKEFEQLFFDTWRTLPDSYAYVGYDVMQFVFHLLKIGNVNYGNFLETVLYKGFHNDIRLQRENPMQGFQNQEINIIKIEESRLKKVND